MEGEQSAEGGGQKVDEDTRKTLKKRCLPVSPALSLRSVQSHSFYFATGLEVGEKLTSGTVSKFNPVAGPPANTQKGS